MKVKNITWTIAQLQKMEEKINPQPQYQRGPVWTRAAKQLLIDSILCHFDIPKIYLHARSGVGAWEYDVTDGQQRMRAIWEFLRDGFPLGDTSYQADAVWSGKKFSELSKAHSQQLLDFELVIAVISDAPTDEVRELFSRLQRGTRLTPAELRNSFPSQLGDAIRSIADTNNFFRSEKCPFDDSRFQHRDLCAHVFAILIYDGKRDLKAPMLKEMFQAHATGVPDGVAAKALKVFEQLMQIQTRTNGAIKTKWGFVDLSFYLARHADEELDLGHIASKYEAFERRRKRYNADPQALLVGSGRAKSAAADSRLYAYIEAFKTSGGLAKNVRARYDALVVELRKPPPKKPATRKAKRK